MSEPYLILHRVRGQPAFDIAEQMACPVCQQGEYPMCIECNEQGWWWIIPTSGHRAHPWKTYKLDTLYITDDDVTEPITNIVYFLSKYQGPMPTDWPDHYPTSTTPHSPSPSGSLAERLGLVPKAPIITRRI